MQKIKMVAGLILKILLIKGFCNSDWLRAFFEKIKCEELWHRYVVCTKHSTLYAR